MTRENGNGQLSQRARVPIERVLQERQLSLDVPFVEQVQLAYQLACIRFPTLRSVDLIQNFDEMPEQIRKRLIEAPLSVATCVVPSKEHPRFRAIINPQLDQEQTRALMADLPQELLKIEAARIGIFEEQLSQNPRIFLFFTLFHELGHAWHFQKVYKNSRHSPEEIRENLNKLATKELTTLPFPLFPPSVLIRLAHDDRGFIERYIAIKGAALGITSVEELIAKQIEAYKNLPSERDADDFAVEVLSLLWEHLQLPDIPRSK